MSFSLKEFPSVSAQPPPPPPLDSRVDYTPFCSKVTGGNFAADPPSPHHTLATHKPNQPPPKSFVDAVVSPPPRVGDLSRDLKKSFLANENPIPIGTKSFFNGRPTLAFSEEETHRLSAHLKLALVGKFSHDAPLYRLVHRLIAGLGLQGPFTTVLLNSKHVLITLTNEEDFTKL